MRQERFAAWLSARSIWREYNSWESSVLRSRSWQSQLARSGWVPVACKDRKKFYPCPHLPKRRRTALKGRSKLSCLHRTLWTVCTRWGLCFWRSRHQLVRGRTLAHWLCSACWLRLCPWLRCTCSSDPSPSHHSRQAPYGWTISGRRSHPLTTGQRN